MFIRHVFDRLHHYMAFVIIYGTETSYDCFNVLLYVYEGFSGLFYLYMGITESTRYVCMCACVCLNKSSCDTFKGTSQPKPEWCSSNGGLCDLQTHVFLMTAGSTAHLPSNFTSKRTNQNQTSGHNSSTYRLCLIYGLYTHVASIRPFLFLDPASLLLTHFLNSH